MSAATTASGPTSSSRNQTRTERHLSRHTEARGEQPPQATAPPVDVNPMKLPADLLAKADTLAAELKELRKTDKELCKKLGLLWQRMLTSIKGDDNQTRTMEWLAIRYRYSTRTVYLYLELAKHWDKAVASFADKAVDWQAMSVNEFMDSYKASPAYQPENTGKRGRPSKQKQPPAQQKAQDGSGVGNSEASAAGISPQGSVPPSISGSEKPPLPGGRQQTQQQAVGADDLASLEASVLTLVAAGKAEVRRVKPGQTVQVTVGDRPVIIMPDRGVQP